MRYLAICTALAAAPALAQEALPFTYDLFEMTVGHVNLSTCPADIAGADRFCRVTMNLDAFHVFAFVEGGEQPLVAVRSYYEDEVDLSFD